MGAKVAGASNYSLPEILRNLDYDDDSDDNLKMKVEDRRPVMDLSFHGELDLKESVQISIVGNGVVRTEPKANTNKTQRSRFTWFPKNRVRSRRQQIIYY